MTAAHMRVGVTKLERRISELQAFDVSTYTFGGANPELDALAVDIQNTLSDVFGANSVEYDRFSPATFFDTGPITLNPFGRGDDLHPFERQKYVQDAIARCAATLRSAVKLLKERLEHEQSSETSFSEPGRSLSRRVFIVHGHDEAAKLSVARFLEQMKFEVVILHEQPNQGRTIIEKIEKNRDVGFVVVLLTPDDECVTNVGKCRRARQNVILELGYFIAFLGRERVVALKKGEVELPSDVLGVVFNDFDDRGAWKLDLARELKAAGYHIDSVPV